MRVKSLLLLFICALFTQPLFSDFAVKDGKIKRLDNQPTLSALEHYSVGLKLMEEKEYDRALHHLNIVTMHFESSPIYQDALFFKSVCQFNNKDYIAANDTMAFYLKQKSRLKHFEEALSYKYAIAQKFQYGAKKHLFNWKKMPKIVPAKENALEIYEEIITTLPNHDLSAKALFSKAEMLSWQKEYRESIDTYQTLIKRFPKHELASKSYLSISHVYFKQSRIEYHNPDLLDLAQINLRRFKEDFPRDENVDKVQLQFLKMQQFHARGLLNTGKLYERKNKPRASVIYYSSAVEKFPQTDAAKEAKKRLKKLRKYAKELKVAESLYQ